ncbi:MAG: hypothetical protein AB1778_00420 [Candidatus Bipolaricaulota bacterium]
MAFVSACLREFHVVRPLILCLAAAAGLAAAGRGQAALGVVAGFLLYLAYVGLLIQSLDSLRREGRRVRAAAAASYLGRLALLGLGLGLLAVFLSREALWGACGAVLVTHVHSVATNARGGAGA